MDNISILYNTQGIFDYEQKYKSIIEADMISTIKVITGNSKMEIFMIDTKNIISARKSLRVFFTKTFKQIIALHW